MYSLLLDPGSGAPQRDIVRRDLDGALIPADPANTDWQAYLTWLQATTDTVVPASDGGVPTAAVVRQPD